MTSYLTECAEYEKTFNRNCLRFHLRHGKILEESFGLWKEEKAKGSVWLSWKDWLKENIGCNDRDARRKREIAQIIAQIIEQFPRLEFVSISFNEFYNRKNSIKTMLSTYTDLCQYWKKKKLREDEVLSDYSDMDLH